jgi:hypothetical protein
MEQPLREDHFSAATREKNGRSAASLLRIYTMVEKQQQVVKLDFLFLFFFGGERMLAAARDNPPTSRASVNQNRSSA